MELLKILSEANGFSGVRDSIRRFSGPYSGGGFHRNEDFEREFPADLE